MTKIRNSAILCAIILIAAHVYFKPKSKVYEPYDDKKHLHRWLVISTNEYRFDATWNPDDKLSEYRILRRANAWLRNYPNAIINNYSITNEECVQSWHTRGSIDSCQIYNFDLTSGYSFFK